MLRQVNNVQKVKSTNAFNGYSAFMAYFKATKACCGALQVHSQEFLHSQALEAGVID
jgi:hypothetical protein